MNRMNMRTIFIVLLSISSYTAHAWQKYDFINSTYYTDPKDGIDQKAYHDLTVTINILEQELINAGKFRRYREIVIENYLLKINTETSLRLLADLHELRL